MYKKRALTSEESLSQQRMQKLEMAVNCFDDMQVQAVEAALNVASPPLADSAPLCRDVQANEMLQLISLHVSNKQGGSIYVSGLPGTGVAPLILLFLSSTRRNCGNSKSPTSCAIEIWTGMTAASKR